MSISLVSFVRPDMPKQVHAGAWLNGDILDLTSRARVAGSPICDDCEMSVIEWLNCTKALEWAAGLVADPDTIPAEYLYPRSEVRLLAPIPNPPKVICLATNYESHLNESRNAQSDKPKRPTPEGPRIFMKPSGNTVCADGDPILITSHSTFCDYEGELAVIIGSACKNVGAATAMRFVGGYACCNDISERDLSIVERTETQEWDKFFDWLNGKWFDNSLPFGPGIVPARFVSDPHALTLRTRVNAELRQETSTGEMFFDIPHTIEYLSKIMTLQPGDIIATGTPAGVGRVMDKALQPGDVVEVEISEIGTLSNPVVGE